MAAADRLSDDRESDLEAPAHADPDLALVTRIRGGDPQAFEALFRAYFPLLWRFAYRYVGARDVAEDIVQTVFEHVWERRSTLSPAGDIKAYLFRAVRNHTINAHKHHIVEARVFDLNASSASATVRDTAPLPDEEVLRAHVRQLIQGLSEPRRTAVVLRYYEGMSFAEIAGVIGSSVKATEMLVARAIRSLRMRV